MGKRNRGAASVQRRFRVLRTPLRARRRANAARRQPASGLRQREIDRSQHPLAGDAASVDFETMRFRVVADGEAAHAPIPSWRRKWPSDSGIATRVNAMP